MRILAMLGLGLVTGLFLLAGGALAADGQAYSIDTAPLVNLLVPYFETALLAVVSAAIAWLSGRLKKWLGVELDARHRAAIESVIRSRANQLLVYAADKYAPSFQTRSAILVDLVAYVQTSVPEAVAHFDLHPERLKSKILGVLVEDPDWLSVLTGGKDDDTANAIPGGYAAAPVDLVGELAGRAAD